MAAVDPLFGAGHCTDDMADPRVFVSYSHDSDAHSEAVLQLAQQLREWGIDVRLDRFVPDPPEGWPRWMMAEIDAADVVILVCTGAYRRRLEGLEEPGKGKGVTFEGLLAIQHLYEASTRNTRFVPVVFEVVDDTEGFAKRQGRRLRRRGRKATEAGAG